MKLENYRRNNKIFQSLSTRACKMKESTKCLAQQTYKYPDNIMEFQNISDKMEI